MHNAVLLVWDSLRLAPIILWQRTGVHVFQSFLKVRISGSDSDSDHLYDHVPVKDQLEMLKHLPEGVSIVKFKCTS